MYVDTKEPFGPQKPSLRDLAYVLRHKELWPQNFTWDFRYVNSCGIGLCHQLYHTTPSMFDEFNQDYDDGTNFRIFATPVSWFKAPLKRYSKRMRMVTPEIVADRIDAYLGKGKKHVEVAEVDLDWTGRPF